MPLLDIIALTVFACCWLLYETMLKRLGEGGGVLNTDMTVIRRRLRQGA